MADELRGSCAVCDKPATSKCAGCVDHLDHRAAPSPTFYCTKTCQDAHWAEHKAACKDLNATTRLFRAGELLQRVFYEYRRAAFKNKLIRIEKRDGKVATYESDYHNGNEAFFGFPSDHSLTDAEDVKALLAYKGCSDAVGILHPLVIKTVSVVIDGPATGLCEMATAMPYDLCRILSHHDGTAERLDTGDYDHDVVTVKLPGAEGSGFFVLDLAGAQYGQFRAVIDNKEWQKTYYGKDKSSKVKIQEEFGNMSGCYYCAANGIPGPNLLSMEPSGREVFKARYRIGERLVQSVDEWVENSGKTLPQLLTSKHPAFKKSVHQLVKKLGVDLPTEAARAGAICMKSLTAKGYSRLVHVIDVKDVPRGEETLLAMRARQSQA